ncbi:uncharacterized protein LOC123294579 [Chrysoperla carnea]|uniref:uncharacterized protein LOC123294579 n=1 Tax=Chrysoperla carnea TaxID=189513 RepID=UPI001D08DB77|nr:uncharacterized protein LOC123294579 [Chrysoperla carnea]
MKLIFLIFILSVGVCFTSGAFCGVRRRPKLVESALDNEIIDGRNRWVYQLPRKGDDDEEEYCEIEEIIVEKTVELPTKIENIEDDNFPSCSMPDQVLEVPDLIPIHPGKNSIKFREYYIEPFKVTETENHAGAKRLVVAA